MIVSASRVLNPVKNHVVSTGNAPNSVPKSLATSTAVIAISTDGWVRAWSNQFARSLSIDLNKIERTISRKLRRDKYIITRSDCTLIVDSSKEIVLYCLIIMCYRSGIIDQTLTRVSLVIASFSQFSKCLAAVAVFFKLASLKYVEGSRNVILIVSCTSRFIDIPRVSYSAWSIDEESKTKMA